MSNYPDSRDPYAQRPRPAANPWPLVFLLVLGGLAAWYFWPRTRDAGPNPDAVPRAVTPRGDLADAEKSIINLYQRASRSVVHITTQAVARNAVFGGREIAQGSGSGFIWDEDGHIVTNNHVIQGANTARVALADGSTWPAERALSYPDKDLAVLRIRVDSKSRLVPIDVGTSNDLKVGQFAYAIGNPYGLDQTLTWGIVSALDREIESSVAGRTIRGVIQTDAAINPGNSGGPLLDSAGRLIGVNTAIVSPSRASAGIGFAIPVDDVRQVVTQLIQKGQVERPLLGVRVYMDQQARQLDVKEGVLLREVFANMPAAKAGLRPSQFDPEAGFTRGDVIVAINGKAVRTVSHLFDMLEKQKAGDVVTVTVLRDGARQDVQVTLEEGR